MLHGRRLRPRKKKVEAKICNAINLEEIIKMESDVDQKG